MWRVAIGDPNRTDAEQEPSMPATLIGPFGRRSKKTHLPLSFKAKAQLWPARAVATQRPDSSKQRSAVPCSILKLRRSACCRIATQRGVSSVVTKLAASVVSKAATLPSVKYLAIISSCEAPSIASAFAPYWLSPTPWPHPEPEMEINAPAGARKDSATRITPAATQLAKRRCLLNTDVKLAPWARRPPAINRHAESFEWASAIWWRIWKNHQQHLPTCASRR